MESIPLWLPLVFFVIAFVYSTVGFGGGSSYLAVLVLIGLSYQVIPQTALVCNLIVSGVGTWNFARGKHLRLKRVLPFIVFAIPAAYFGGRLAIGRETFMLLLGLSLLVAGLRLFFPGGPYVSQKSLTVRRAWIVGPGIGALLGFLAGTVGIGGGIFLAPVLLFSGWARAKETAAAASLFILLNSASGLAGQLSKGMHLDAVVIPLAAAVLLGGALGSRTGAVRLPVVGFRRVMAGLIVAVGARLIWSAL